MIHLDPSRVRLFVVGVIEFENEKVAGYPQEGRRDAELVQWFVEHGTPGKQRLYLQDSQATLAAIKSGFSNHLDASQPDETLVFYYTGHGAQCSRGITYLIPHDWDRSKFSKRAWSVQDVINEINRRFKGKQIILLADCCFSSALGHAARDHAKVGWASLSSSLLCPSTGRWTFTESLLAGLRGNSGVDLDGDGDIFLGELGRFTEQEMAFVDGQLSSYTYGNGFSPSLRISQRKGPPSLRPNRFEVWWKGGWYPAKIQERKRMRTFIRYSHHNSSWDEWVGPLRRRPYSPKVYQPGTKVLVQRKGSWVRARVVEGRLGVHKVSYEDLPNEAHEWVSPNRLRRRILPIPLLNTKGRE